MAIISKGQITITKVNDGTGVVSIVDEYYLSTSSTQLLGGTWVSVAPGLKKGYYLWSRTTITYSDGVVDVTDPIMISGEHGADGYTIVLTNEAHSVVCDAAGTPITGEIGSSGRAKSDIIVYKDTTQLVAVANTATPTTGQFNYTIGTVTNGTASRTDNDTFYLNTITSNSASIPITINVENTKSFSKSMTVTKSIAGQNGTNASYVSITPSNLFFKCLANSTVYSPTTITLTPTFVNSSYANWQYSIDGGTTWVTVTSGSNGLTITGNILSVGNSSSLFTSSVTSVAFKVNGSNSVTDVITLAKLKDGDNGSNGSNGSDGKDSVSILLSNENHTFIATSNGNAIASNITINIYGYIGTTLSACTIGTISGTPTGMTITKSNSGTTSSNLSVSVTTSLNTKNGVITIPITCGGVTINKNFTYSLAVAGSDGSNGSNGTNAKSVDILPSSQIFKSTDGGLNFSPSTITLNTVLQNVTYSKWQYSTNGGASWIDVASGSNGLTVASGILTISKDSNLYTSAITSIVFKLITNDSSIYDTCTISKLYDISDLEIGGRNLIRNSSLFKGSDYWSLTTNVSIDTEMRLNGYSSIKSAQTGLTSDDWRGGINRSLPDSPISMLAGETYTYSVWYYVADKTTFDSGLTLELKGKKSGSTSESGMGSISVSSANIEVGKWTRIYKTITLSEPFTEVCYRFWVQRNGTAWFSNFKLERGNKVTDFTPSVEDILDNIYDSVDNLDKQVTEKYTASIDVMKNRITSEVSETYTTKDMFTKETNALSSKVEQTAKDITNTFTSKTDLMIGDLQAYKEEVSTNIRFSSDGIDIGKTNSNFKMNLSNTALQFKDNNTVIAEVTNKRLDITDGKFKNSMAIGRFEFRPDDAGNLVMVWATS